MLIKISSQQNAPIRTMKISIIICTRNRAKSLRDTLLSISNTLIPEDLDVELLIVDNGSNDDTKDVAHNCQITKVHVRYVNESIPGQCHARNRGLSEATGDVFLFTDDDVRVPMHWIEGMCRPILTEQADAVAGAVIFPERLEKSLAKYGISNRRGWLASTDGIDANHPNRMVGANMAFSKRVLDKVPAFDTRLGPGALGFADETLFSRRLIASGYKMITAFDTAVEHHFDDSRFSRKYMLSIADRMGRSQAYMAYHWEQRNTTFNRKNLTRARLGLWYHRLMKPGQWIGQSAASDWELLATERIAYISQFMDEQKQPRLYRDIESFSANTTNTHRE